LDPKSAPAKALVEVYPHPALIEILKAPRRLEYKATKAGKYWRTLPLAVRHNNLREVSGA
jgi:predicted RNase H-like nuclease